MAIFPIISRSRPAFGPTKLSKTSHLRQPPPPLKNAPPPPPPQKHARTPLAQTRRRKDEAISPSCNQLTEKQCQKLTARTAAPTVMRDVDAFKIMHKIGEGTYGSVLLARDNAANEIVALKQIKSEREENGFPLTALREIIILKALNHVNIVNLKEIVASKDFDFFMVFEYMEFDLTGILETPEIVLTQDHVKSWSWQLLSGCHYMHTNKILHRDLKTSNILINRTGELKIADWGLSRTFNNMERLTNNVVTLWYRPPELLLGCVNYTTKIDMWSVGCIIAEMFRRSVFLKGSNETTQLDLIFRTCGHPTKETWPEIETQCRLWKRVQPGQIETNLPNRLAEVLRSNLPNSRWMTDEAVRLISKLLELNPNDRWSARHALLESKYFFESPEVKTAKDLHMRFTVTSLHEIDCKDKYEKKISQLNA